MRNPLSCLRPLPLLLLFLPAAAAAACIGDCNGDGVVSSRDLAVMAARVTRCGAAATAPCNGLPTCPAGDPDLSGFIDAAELRAAVRSVTLGCGVPTPTPLPCPRADLGSGGVRTASGATTTLPNLYAASCGGGGASEMTYAYTAPATGMYTIDTLGSAFDTVLAVHDDTCTGAELACNDDLAPTNRQSLVTVPLKGGQRIVIMVDGFATSAGNFTLTVAGALTPKLTASPTPTPTVTPTRSPSATATRTPSSTATPSPTATASATPSRTPTITASPTNTATRTPTQTPSASPTATPTQSPSTTPTRTFTPTSTPTFTASAMPTPTRTPTVTPSITPTRTRTLTPTPVAVCGNGIIEAPEGCDDKNVRNLDGCDYHCQVEPGYQCLNEPSQCIFDIGSPGYVANELSGTLSVISTQSGTAAVAALAEVSVADATGDVALGGIPRDVAITKDGRLGYVALRNPDAVAVLDMATRQVMHRVPAAGRPESIVLDPSTGATAFVAEYQANSVAILNTATNSMTGSIPVGQGPNDIAVTPDAHKLLVTNSIASTLTAIDAMTGATQTFACSQPADCDTPNSVAVSPKGDVAYVTNFLSGTVSVVDPATNQVTFNVFVDVLDDPSLPTGVTFSPDGALAYVTTFGSNAVIVIDTATQRVVNAIRNVGAFPARIQMSPRGDFAFVTNFALNADGTAAPGTVSMINARSNSVLPDRIPVGRFPVSVAIAPPPPTSAGTATPTGATPTLTRTPVGSPTPTPNCGSITCNPPNQCSIDVGCHRLGGDCTQADMCLPPATPSSFSELSGRVDVESMRSDDNTVYFVVTTSAANIGALITSLAISTGPVLAFNEPFIPPDQVLTSFSSTFGGVGVVDLSRVRRTAVLSGFITNQVSALSNFDPSGANGRGILNLPGPAFRTVSTDAASSSETLQPIIGVQSDGLPAAQVTQVRRRRGTLTVRGETIVFPHPTGPVVTSTGATCGADNPIPCDPSDPSGVTCGGGPCRNLGGETVGQNATLDDTIGSTVGVPAQTSGPDGFLLQGNCFSSLPTCQIIVFAVDATDLPGAISFSASGFLVDGSLQNGGTVGGTAVQ